MAKRAAAKKSTARKSVKKTTRRAARGRRAADGVDFKPLHDAMDATLEQLKGRKKSAKRDGLILKLKLLRKFSPCPNTGMFVELK
jgi:hypothetical protein